MQYASKLSSWIVFESKSLIVINKPSGLPVQGGTRVADSLDALVRSHLQAQESTSTAHLLHRLDRDTSGLVLFAKNKETAAQFGSLFQSRSIKKTYLAIVHGRWPFDEAQRRVALPLTVEKLGQVDRTFVDLECGKESLTDMEVLAAHPSQKYTLLKLNPRTGRKHQLRVHCSHLRFPIVGDTKYGIHNHITAAGKGKPLSKAITTPLCLHAYEVQVGDEAFPVASPPKHFESFFPQLNSILSKHSLSSNMSFDEER